MENIPLLSRITIYPVKSLDGMALREAMIADGGCLLHDREYAIVDADGQFIIGKTNPLVHSLRSSVDFEHGLISFRRNKETEWDQFHLEEDTSAIHSYLTGYFGIPSVLYRDTQGRFMDIPDVAGATVLSTASLKTISGWFGNLDLEETRKRFRATLEIEGVLPFWEDRLFAAEGVAVEFRIGEVTLFGMSPRTRCVVPTRNPESGEVTHAFPKIFARHRAASLPEWSHLDEFGNHYYLTVNCHIPATETGKWIRVGDEVRIIGERSL